MTARHLNADAVAFNIRRWWDAANPYHNGDFVYFEASLVDSGAMRTA